MTSGRSLGEENLLAIISRVQRGHEAVFGFERDGINARMRALLGFPVHPEFRSEGVECPFGRVTLHLPDAILLKQFGIVAQQ